MGTVRKTVVSGSFYPSNPDELRKIVTRYLDNAQVSINREKEALGVIAPHAGYVYSGQCAAYSYQAIREKEFDLAVILAPSHQYGDFYYSVGDFESYKTPLGMVKVNQEYVQKLLKDSKFVFYPYAHNQEHSLEVQLPFLQIIKPTASILPILIGKQYDQSSEYLSKLLASLLSERIDKTIFIVSSDLSHYHDAKTAESLDNRVIEAVEKLDECLLWELIKEQKAEACGFGAILTLIHLSRLLGFQKVETLNYTHSGHTGGNHSQVVGYLSTLFYR